MFHQFVNFLCCTLKQTCNAACTHQVFCTVTLQCSIKVYCPSLIGWQINPHCLEDVQSLVTIVVCKNLSTSRRCCSSAFLSLHTASLFYSLLTSPGPVIRVMMRDFLCSDAQYQRLSWLAAQYLHNRLTSAPTTCQLRWRIQFVMICQPQRRGHHNIQVVRVQDALKDGVGCRGFFSPPLHLFPLTFSRSLS